MMRRLSGRNLIQSRPHHRRRGSLYIAVMAIATIVSIIGFSAMTVARAKLKMAEETNDMRVAQMLAVAAVENALSDINDDHGWRGHFTNDVEYPATPISLGGGTISCKIVDVDGDLDNGDAHNATLYGIGRYGDAVQVCRVDVEPNEFDGNEMKIKLGSWEDTDAP